MGFWGVVGVCSVCIFGTPPSWQTKSVDPEYDLTERRVMVDWSSNLPLRSHTGIDTAVNDTTANMSCSKTFFLANSVYTNNVLNAGVHV